MPFPTENFLPRLSEIFMNHPNQLHRFSFDGRHRYLSHSVGCRMRKSRFITNSWFLPSWSSLGLLRLLELLAILFVRDVRVSVIGFPKWFDFTILVSLFRRILQYFSLFPLSNGMPPEGVRSFSFLSLVNFYGGGDERWAEVETMFSFSLNSAFDDFSFRSAKTDRLACSLHSLRLP